LRCNKIGLNAAPLGCRAIRPRHVCAAVGAKPGRTIAVCFEGAMTNSKERAHWMRFIPPAVQRKDY
jgi:hypothetical protein